MATAAAHALSGITADAVGIAIIKVNGIEGLRSLQEALVQKPWRKIFLLVSNDSNQPEGYQLCVGTQCLEPTLDIPSLTAKL